MFARLSLKTEFQKRIASRLFWSDRYFEMVRFRANIIWGTSRGVNVWPRTRALNFFLDFKLKSEIQSLDIWAHADLKSPRNSLDSLPSVVKFVE